MSFRQPVRARGFSLIEMLVAMVILALSLGVLYQAAAGATRNVRIDERYTYAVQIAQSLLAEHPSLLADGINSSGTTDDFTWHLRSSPYSGGRSMQGAGSEDERIQLLQLEATVRWGELNGDGRETTLVTVVPVHIEQVLPEPIDGL